jgi:hypothetical protein
MMVGAPKVGKSTIMALLPKAGILNIEPQNVDGYRFLRHKAITMEPKNYQEFTGLVKEAMVWSKANGGKKPYDYFIIDNMDEFQAWAEELATTLYMESEQGKTFNRWTAAEIQKEGLAGQVNVGQEKQGKHRKSVVTALAKGGGYNWLRIGFQKLISLLPILADKIIYVCHVRIKNLNKGDMEQEVKSANLVGQIAPMLAGMCDACCFLYRKDKDVIADFAVNDDIAGCRIPHLDGKQIVISHKNDDGSISTFWDRIYPELHGIEQHISFTPVTHGV